MPKPDPEAVLKQVMGRAYASGRNRKTDKLKKDFLKALISTNGKVDKAVELSGVDYGLVYLWWDKDNNFRRYIDHIRKHLLFLLEIDSVGEAFGKSKDSARLRAFQLRAYKPTVYAEGIKESEDAKDAPFYMKVVETQKALKRSARDEIRLLGIDDQGSETSGGDRQGPQGDDLEQVVAASEPVRDQNQGPAADAPAA